MELILELMDWSATLLVETPFAALGLVCLFGAVCWWGATACAESQEMNQ